MKLWIILVIMIVGAILFVFGALLAYYFANWNLVFFWVTMWRDVITFSIISLVGLAMLIFGIIKLARLRRSGNR
jgi:hypothetical protein